MFVVVVRSWELENKQTGKKANQKRDIHTQELLGSHNRYHDYCVNLLQKLSQVKSLKSNHPTGTRLSHIPIITQTQSQISPKLFFIIHQNRRCWCCRETRQTGGTAAGNSLGSKHIGSCTRGDYGFYTTHLTKSARALQNKRNGKREKDVTYRYPCQT